MEENKKEVRLGEGVPDGLKRLANKYMLEIGQQMLEVVSKYMEEKIEKIDFDKLFSKENREKLVKQWSDQFIQKEISSQEYAELPKILLDENMHQEGYVDGIYAGYVLVMMSLVDNNAPKDLILSVRDDMRLDLAGRHYSNREELYGYYKDEKYRWIEELGK